MYLSALSYFLYNRPFEDLDIKPPVSEVQEEIPEFPSMHASFPSTPTIPLRINSLYSEAKLKKSRITLKTKKIIKNLFQFNKYITDTTLWYKDESINPTGTHKDRMAWEIYLWYDSEIKKQINIPGQKIFLKSLSLISSGSAAYSVQKLLRDRGLPNLRVLMDLNTDPSLIKFLESKDCKVYLQDLDAKEYSSKEILEIR